MKKGIIVYLILVVSVLVSIFYGFQKEGFHEDEYYTYFSSNRSLGLYQPDREWQDRQTVLDEFCVKPGEGFNYGLVNLVQSWDVHPPIYYFIFHTMCSFVPSVFTKWPGLITNLIAFVIAYLALFALMKRLNIPYHVMLPVLAFWGINPQTVSCNMLIRMYAWLTAAVFICAYLHVRFIQEYEANKDNLKNYCIKLVLPIAVVSYIGVLIQYFYIFFFGCIGFALSCWLFFKKKDIKNTVVYIAGCGLSMVCAVLSYPAMLHHLFGGYRGTGATGSMFDLANTFMRLSFFSGLLNDFVFAGALWIVLLVLVAGIIYIVAKKKEKITVNAETTVLIAATLGDFFLTTKAALLVGSASNRYEMPVYGLMILIVFWALYVVNAKIGFRVYLPLVLALFVSIIVNGHVNGKSVLFLYKEDVAKISYASENKDEVAVVMFNPATPHNVWRLTDELLQYDRVFYMNEENVEKLTEPDVINADKIILYVADSDLKEAAINNLTDSCTKVQNLTQIDSEDMWTTCEIK
jgi:hypothetical protein